MQFAAVLRITEKNNLLPLDLALRIVLDDYYNDRQVVFDCGKEFAHQHREAAVADESNRLTFGKSKLGGDCIRQARRHSRQISRAAKLLRAAHFEVARNPSRDRS